MATYLTFRLPQVGDSLWLDELHTSWTILGGLTDISHRSLMGNHTPWYFYANWACTRVFGESEVAFRLPSLLAGLTTTIAIFYMVNHWTRSIALAALASLSVCLDGHFRFYSVEARPYALVQLLALVQIFFFWKTCVYPSKWNRATWVSCSVLLFYLHCTSALLLAGAASSYLVWWFWRKGKDPVYALHNFACDVFAICILFLPNVPYLLKIYARRENWELFIGKYPPSSILEIVSFQQYFALPLIVWLVVAAVLVVRGSEFDLRTTGPLLTMTFFVATVPSALAWLITNLDVARIFFIRYVVSSTPSAILFSSALGAMLSNRTARVVFSTVLILFNCCYAGTASYLWNLGKNDRHSNENWRAAVNYVNNSANEKHLPVFLRSGLIEADGLTERPTRELNDYCLLPITSIYRLQCPRYLLPLPNTNAGRLKDTQASLIAASKGAWFIIRGRSETTRNVVDRVYRSLDEFGIASARLESTTTSFGNINVVSLQFVR